jgi:hypothetical protein
MAFKISLFKKSKNFPYFGQNQSCFESSPTTAVHCVLVGEEKDTFHGK